MAIDIKQLRFFLHLDVPPLDNVPDDWITAALGRNKPLSDEFGTVSLYRLGESVLKLIITEFLFRHRDLISIQQANEIRSEMFRNRQYIFTCILNEKGICSILKTTPEGCKNYFFNIVGVIYWSIYTVEDPYVTLYDWFIRLFKMRDIYRMILNKQRIPCQPREETITLSEP